MKKTVSAVGLIRQAARTRGITLNNLADDALIASSTFVRRLKQPSSFKVEELRNLFDAMLLDGDEAMNIIAELFWGGDE